MPEAPPKASGIKLYHNAWVDLDGLWMPQLVTFLPCTHGWYVIRDRWRYDEDGTPAPETPDAPGVVAVYDLQVDPVLERLQKMKILHRLRE